MAIKSTKNLLGTFNVIVYAFVTKLLRISREATLVKTEDAGGGEGRRNLPGWKSSKAANAGGVTRLNFFFKRRNDINYYKLECLVFISRYFRMGTGTSNNYHV